MVGVEELFVITDKGAIEELFVITNKGRSVDGGVSFISSFMMLGVGTGDSFPLGAVLSFGSITLGAAKYFTLGSICGIISILGGVIFSTLGATTVNGSCFGDFVFLYLPWLDDSLRIFLLIFLGLLVFHLQIYEMERLV